MTDFPIYNIIFAIGLFNTIFGVALGQLMLVLPFAVWMLKGYFDNLPKEIEDAARIDGCSLFQTLTRVVIPISAPGSRKLFHEKSHDKCLDKCEIIAQNVRIRGS